MRERRRERGGGEKSHDSKNRRAALGERPDRSFVLELNCNLRVPRLSRGRYSRVSYVAAKQCSSQTKSQP